MKPGSPNTLGHIVIIRAHTAKTVQKKIGFVLSFFYVNIFLI